MKPLARADHAGGHIVATRAGLDSSDSHEQIHIAWQDCLGAVWDAPRLTVSVARDGIVTQHAWLIPDPGDFPAVVRDRIASVVVMDLRRDFAGHGSVRFVARRRGDGVEWLTLADDADWAESAQGRPSIAAELAGIRSTLGV